jgi:hypothetical protein
MVRNGNAQFNFRSPITSNKLAGWEIPFGITGVHAPVPQFF